MVRNILHKNQQNKGGFTLVELLVATTIVGILAVFATTQYRNSVAETRWEQAKAQANQLAAAVQRVQLDYAVSFASGPMSNTTGNSCSLTPTSGAPAACLIQWNYLEPSSWDNDYYLYYVCQGFDNSKCTAGDDLVCVHVKESAKLPAKYKKFTYCVSATSSAKESRS